MHPAQHRAIRIDCPAHNITRHAKPEQAVKTCHPPPTRLTACLTGGAPHPPANTTTPDQKLSARRPCAYHTKRLNTPLFTVCCAISLNRRTLIITIFNCRTHPSRFSAGPSPLRTHSITIILTHVQNVRFPAAGGFSLLR